MTSHQILKPKRTEFAKEYRRLHGDRGGCRFSDRNYEPSSDPWSNCISTVTKDNLILVRYA